MAREKQPSKTSAIPTPDGTTSTEEPGKSTESYIPPTEHISRECIHCGAIRIWDIIGEVQSLKDGRINCMIKCKDCGNEIEYTEEVSRVSFV